MQGEAGLLASSWARAWADLGLVAPSSLHERLLAAWSAPQRHYHTLVHLAECLAHFEGVRELARNPGAVAIALWFHDAIYQVRGNDNEQCSADWAARELAAAGAPESIRTQVADLILATRHDALPQDPDARLLVDIDLAILGAPPERFAEYDRQVRAEYAWVPGCVYRHRRRAVLRSFLGREAIYATTHFRTLLEAQARRNLASAIT